MRLFKKKKKEPEVFKAVTNNQNTLDAIDDTADRKEYDLILSKKKRGYKGAKYKIPITTDKDARKRNFKSFIKFLIPIAITIVFFNIVIMLAFIPSKSMSPTLKVGDFAVFNRLAYIAKSPQRGDIIVFRHDKELLVKRVIGMPGDSIELKEGRIYINGSLLDEPYLLKGVYTLPYEDGNNLSTYTVPDDYIFVLGDNRSDSVDSRYWTDVNGNAAPYVNLENVLGNLLVSFPTGGNGNIAFYGEYAYANAEINVNEIETTDILSQTLEAKSDNTDTVLETKDPDSVVVETLSVSDYKDEETTAATVESTEESTLSIGEFE